MAKKVVKSTKKSETTLQDYLFPKTIKITSDDNEMQLQLQSFKEGEAVYVYVKSITKKGMPVTVSFDYLTQMIADKIFVVCR